MTELAKQLSGKFIVIDGPDGAGKSTQIKLLSEFLAAQDAEVTFCRDPGGTAIGDKIRAILLDNAHHEMAVQCELMLYMASRAQLVKEVIKPSLAHGRCVLCDRYVSATLAYQGAGGVNAASILAAAEIAVDGCWPDLTVILDLPSEIGLGRIKRACGADRMEVKGLAFHRRVRENFLQQARDNSERFAVVDAAAEPAKVQARLQEAIVAFAQKARPAAAKS